jgi:diaminopimelate epimerase
MNKKIYLITAAGGNGTAIQVLDQALTREQYIERGTELGNSMEADGAEQAGFLIPSDSHFEMAGGEFCGNASRAAALLFSEILAQRAVSFTVSGFDGTVSASVEKKSDQTYFVQCTFPGMPTQQESVVLSNDQHADIIDLGGIVHVVIEGVFPSERAAYESAHKAISKELGFEDRGAVGVVWYERVDDKTVKMYPVVWVKDVKTFFYEKSCGSGTIAVGKVTGLTSIIQPTGKRIEAIITDDAVILQSEMEITRAEH